MDPVALWSTCTAVERTCLQTCLGRWKASGVTDMSGRPLFTDEIAESLVHAIIPKDEQEEMLNGPDANFIFCMMAVRTAAIDRCLVRSALDIPRADIQVVLIGAGMDTRAWRIPVPDRQLRWFEVDTSAVLDCKQRLLADKPTLHSRCCVPADVTDGAQLEKGLLQAGFSKDTPTVWVLEGFLGYITQQQQSGLAQVLHRLSAPGSRVVASGPPTEEVRQHMAAMGVPLHHKDFSPVEAVVERFGGAGWAVLEVLSPQQLEAQYGIAQHLDLFVLSC